jgi:hypothetical protein
VEDDFDRDLVVAGLPENLGHELELLMKCPINVPQRVTHREDAITEFQPTDISGRIVMDVPDFGPLFRNRISQGGDRKAGWLQIGHILCNTFTGLNMLSQRGDREAGWLQMSPILCCTFTCMAA